MRYCLAVISVILPVSFMSPVFAASQRDWSDCNQTRDPDRSIFTCTRIIRGKGETAQSRSYAYTDRGNAYNAKGDFDCAFADYDAAIRLDPKNAKAYNNRGAAYYAKSDIDRAIADYGEAIRLDPKYVNAYNNRGVAYKAMGNHDRAIADYNEVISLDPKYVKAYINRGTAYFYSDSLAKAQTDFKKSNELAPKDAFAALWLDLAERRNNIPSHLAEAATQLDMKAWPAPVIRLFLGELTPTAVLAGADDPKLITKEKQVCGANFYSGELALLDGSKQEAARLFRIAADSCLRNFIEWVAANAELKSLDSKL